MPVWLVEKWVLYTNQYVESLLRDQGRKPQARLRKWKPTFVEEIYLWLGIVIHIGIHRDIRIQDYWKVPTQKNQGTIHTIIRYITYSRFFLLLRYIRIFEQPNEAITTTTYDRIWGRVDEWSDHIQKATTDLVILGTNCAIDECMVRNKGRCKGNTIVKGKPIPRGLKVWAIGQLGLLLRWIWHVPKHPWGFNKVRKEEKPTTRVNPTQAVVVFLVKSLPATIYHVYHIFFDNLFSTPNLFRRLREEGFAATGTARLNSGFYQPLIAAKRADKSRAASSFVFNKVKAAPTKDNMVRSL